MKAENESIPGVTVSLQELIGLQYRTAGFSLLPRQPVRSLLAGRYGSRLRGRGLNFEEIRQYHPGDDIRNMDWKVTARTGKPHTRVYTEERDRPVIIVVDQRVSMFFGSKVNMKSVTAAQLGALCIWKATQDQDRAGAIIFNDTTIEQIRPHRSQKNVTEIVNRLVRFSTELVDRNKHQNTPEMLNRVLEQIAIRNSHDYLYIVISDFSGVNDKSYRFAKQISRNNDLLLFLVHDPLAREVPKKGIFTLTDGVRKVELDPGYNRIKKELPGLLEGRINQLVQELSNFGVPTLPFNNVDDVADQLKHLLGLPRTTIQRPSYP